MLMKPSTSTCFINQLTKLGYFSLPKEPIICIPLGSGVT